MFRSHYIVEDLLVKARRTIDMTVKALSFDPERFFTDTKNPLSACRSRFLSIAEGADWISKEVILATLYNLADR